MCVCGGGGAHLRVHVSIKEREMEERLEIGWIYIGGISSMRAEEEKTLFREYVYTYKLVNIWSIRGLSLALVWLILFELF